jgi:hypothetical protein
MRVRLYLLSLASRSMRRGHILNMAARICPVLLSVTSETRKAVKRHIALVTPNSIKEERVQRTLFRWKSDVLKCGDGEEYKRCVDGVKRVGKPCHPTEETPQKGFCRHTPDRGPLRYASLRGQSLPPFCFPRNAEPLPSLVDGSCFRCPAHPAPSVADLPFVKPHLSIGY